MSTELLVWLVPLLPFAGFLFQVFVGRHLPRVFVNIVSCGVVLASFLVAGHLFLELRAQGGDDPRIVSSVARWISVTVSDSGWAGVLVEHKLVVDPLSAVMILVVTGIGFFIHLYSTGYMKGDPRYARYFAFLNLFTGFMLILVLASNLLLMFVGWEGVGLCSYLLIGFWFEKKENAVAGMKAFIVNRIGDFGFTVGVLILFVTLGTHAGVWTFDVQEIGAAVQGGKLSVGVITVVALLLFVGAAGKSAQIPLYVWLPDAMAGPTPVSALIHAATMVTAGVYMVARMNFLFAMAPVAQGVVVTIGALTALFAGTIGMAQNDIKKVLAYSTISQLGFMFMGVGVGAFAAGVFHLFTHAFFKACLFLGSGSVIHGMGGEQDMRRMGGLKKVMPWTFATFAVASLAIAGIPPLAGFFSKDEILWKTFSAQQLALPFAGTVSWYGQLMWGVGAVAAACTAFYMTRLVVRTFLGRPAWGAAHEETPAAPEPHAPQKSGMDLPSWMEEEEYDRKKDVSGHDDQPTVSADKHHDHGAPHECPWSMRIALVVLALGSVVVGFLGVPAALGGHDLFGTWLHSVWATPPEAHGDPLVIEYILMAVSVALAVLGIALAWWIYRVREGRPAEAFARRYGWLHGLVLDKYRVDEAYNEVVIQPLLSFNENVGKFDNGVIDGAVNGTAERGAQASHATGYFDNEVVDGALNAGAKGTMALGRQVRRLQTGNIRHYLTCALVGGLFVIALFTLLTAGDDGPFRDFINRLFGGTS